MLHTSPPDTLVIHLGGNNLGYTKGTQTCWFRGGHTNVSRDNGGLLWYRPAEELDVPVRPAHREGPGLCQSPGVRVSGNTIRHPAIKQWSGAGWSASDGWGQWCIPWELGVGLSSLHRSLLRRSKTCKVVHTSHTLFIATQWCTFKSYLIIDNKYTPGMCVCCDWYGRGSPNYTRQRMVKTYPPRGELRTFRSQGGDIKYYGTNPVISKVSWHYVLLCGLLLTFRLPIK